MKRYVWEVSVKNSLIHFKVKYLQISNITGHFVKFRGEVIADAIFNNPEVYLFIEANSVETLDERRNARLRADSFLWDEQHPFIEFSCVGGCRQSSGKIWELTGDLVVKGVKRSVTLVVNFSDVKEGRRPTASFHLFGKVSREDMGLVCADGEDVSDEVNLYAEMFLTRKAGGIDIS